MKEDHHTLFSLRYRKISKLRQSIVLWHNANGTDVCNAILVQNFMQVKRKYKWGLLVFLYFLLHLCIQYCKKIFIDSLIVIFAKHNYIHVASSYIIT